MNQLINRSGEGKSEHVEEQIPNLGEKEATNRKNRELPDWSSILNKKQESIN